ncbi:MAG: AAA family ATPase [Nocardioidaceae bacterium]
MSTGVLVALGAVEFETALLEVAAADGFHVVRRCVDVPDLLASSATRQAQVALVSAGLRGLDSDVVSRIRDDDVSVVGVVVEQSSADEAGLRRLGIDTIVYADDLERFADLVDDAQGPAKPLDLAEGEVATVTASRPTRNGKVVAVWGPTGAPGRSVVTVGMSAALGDVGASVMLVDADVYGGSCAQMLGLLDESSGLLAAVRLANAGRLTTDLLAAQARQITPAMRVLTGIPSADRWPELRTGLLRNVLDVARSCCGFTVVDCGFSIEADEEISYDTAAPRRNGATLAVLDLADEVVVVGGADPVGLGRLVRALNELSVAAPRGSRHVVVNRMRGSLGWSTDEIADVLARTAQVDGVTFLPDDQAACDKSAVLGRALTECAPESKLTKALRELAAQVAGVPAPKPARKAWVARGR